jgi:hypothetical protein
MDFSTFIEVHIPRKDKKEYDSAIRERYEKYATSYFNEVVNNTLGNYYDKYISLNDYNYCVGNILAEKQ